MASTNPANSRQYWSTGRGFASVDPERQGEVVGYVRSGGIETAPPARSLADRTAKPVRKDWMRVQPDVETGFEGSSSRRWR